MLQQHPLHPPKNPLGMRQPQQQLQLSHPRRQRHGRERKQEV